MYRLGRKGASIRFSVTVLRNDGPLDDAMVSRLRKASGTIVQEGRGQLGRYPTWWVVHEAKAGTIAARNKSVWVSAGDRWILFSAYAPAAEFTIEDEKLFDSWIARCTIIPETGEITTLSWIIAGAGVVLAIAVMMWVRRSR